MNACTLEEWYILPDHLFCQPISYVMASLTLFLFFSSLIDPTSWNMTDFCAPVFLIFKYEEPPQSTNISQAIIPCLHILHFLQLPPQIPAKVDSKYPRALLILSPNPPMKLHPQYPLEGYTVLFGCCISGVTRMVSGLVRNMKRKIMVAENFVLFFPVTLELNVGS